ncbi:hypothetical protein ALP01_200013 [Pseudomonas caricapapayae]|nr:hypothetical protein ALP01_200013 [Pseudomonas caricapapayae]
MSVEARSIQAYVHFWQNLSASESIRGVQVGRLLLLDFVTQVDQHVFTHFHNG